MTPRSDRRSWHYPVHQRREFNRTPGGMLRDFLSRMCSCLTPSRATTRNSTRRLVFEAYEPRDLMSVLGTEPLPTKIGEVFVVNDWDYVVTKSHMGFNYFSGNGGAVETVAGIATQSLSPVSRGSVGGSLRFDFDFRGKPTESYAGRFESVMGLTDTYISLDGSGVQPPTTTQLPGYFLNTRDVFEGFGELKNRSLDQLRFDVQRLSAEPITLRVELKDESGRVVFSRVPLAAPIATWQTVSLPLATGFTRGDVATFDRNRVSILATVVEHVHVADGIQNPDTGTFLLDNLEWVDVDGLYPDLQAAMTPDGQLAPQYSAAFLDVVRREAAQYFLDWASTDPRTGGLPHDRGTFGDLLTIGGVGFQLSTYVVDAERGYLTREEAARRTRDILQKMWVLPQGANRVGMMGYQGFYYHFVGIDGLRKQNFDRPETEVDEHLNTVELSTIDTALAVAGALTAAQYFANADGVETEIRALANQIFARVNWNFMLYENAGNAADPQNKQFLLGWKPNEERDDSGTFGRFKLNDAQGLGQYSSRLEAGTERPATLDYYTDEGLLVAMLAMGSPNPSHRVGPEAWYAMIRDDEGDSFVKSYPGSLFTYQFAGLWLDTEALGYDNHPEQPLNFYQNTKAAIEATRAYAIANPEGHQTLSSNLWGLTATEGPLGAYEAYAAPPAAIPADRGVVVPGPLTTIEAESVPGRHMFRGNASGGKTTLLYTGESLVLPFDLTADDLFDIRIRYSNDNFGPLETITVRLDGQNIGSFQAQDTGDGGFGWNIFAVGGDLDRVALQTGHHEFALVVSGGDGYGVEIDWVRLAGESRTGPLEDGTVSTYGAASSLAYLPGESVAALAYIATQLTPNAATRRGLNHPRMGIVDTLNLQIADALAAKGLTQSTAGTLRSEGPYASFTQFAINAGPMAIAIDNYLTDNFLPHVFMSHPDVQRALRLVFPNWNPAQAGAHDIAGRAATTGDWWVAVSQDTKFENQLWGRWTGTTWHDVRQGDFDGDGRTDLVGRNTGGEWWVAQSTGTAFSTRLWGSWAPTGWSDVMVADVTGDHRADLVGRYTNGDWWVAKSTGTAFVNQRWGNWVATGWSNVDIADVNGDGKSDLVGRFNNGDWWVGKSTGAGFVNQRWTTWASSGWSDVRVADVNGDRRADIVGRYTNGEWWVAKSTGSAFINERWGIWAATGWSDVRTGDVDGDGRTDIIGRYSNGDWWVARSTGTGFLNQLWGSWSPTGWASVFAADVNGDGKTDLVGRYHTGDWWVARSIGNRFVNAYWGKWSNSVAWLDVSADQFSDF